MNNIIRPYHFFENENSMPRGMLKKKLELKSKELDGCPSPAVGTK